MAKSTGSNVATAMQHLLRAGYDPKRIAADLDLTPRTTRAWARGLRHPRKANLANLRDLLHEYRRDLTRRNFTNRSQRHADDLLFAAIGVLQTDAERAELAALEAKVAAHRAEMQARLRSITTQVDPFQLRCVAYAIPDPAIPGWRVTPAIGARPEWAETRDGAIAGLDEATKAATKRNERQR